MINQAIDQCDAEEDKGDEKVPELVKFDDEKSDDDQDDIPDLESIPSDYEEPDPNHQDCKFTNFVLAPASAIYDMNQVKCTIFCNDTFRAVKETDQILELCQIQRGAVVKYPK